MFYIITIITQKSLRMEEYFYKQNVEAQEYLTQDFVYNQHIVNVPRPHKYRPMTKILKMVKIPNMSVADYWGENFNKIPTNIIEEIRTCIEILYNNYIEYPDITGYNFIYHDGKIWIIDFEHAKYNIHRKTYDPFILSFINGHNGWNPDYN